MRCWRVASRAARSCWRGGDSFAGWIRRDLSAEARETRTRKRRNPPLLLPRREKRWVTLSTFPHPKKSGARGAAFEIRHRRGLRRLGFRLLLRRPGVLAFGVDVAIDELDHRHRCVVAIAETGLDDAGVAAVAVLVAGRQHVEQLLDLIEVAHLADRLAAHRQPALLAERDQLLDDRPQLLGLRERGDDLLVLDQRGGHVGEHGGAMARRAAQLAVRVTVAHGGLSSSLGAASRRALQRKIRSGLRTSWPARRCSRAASWARPCRGAGPC